MAFHPYLNRHWSNKHGGKKRVPSSILCSQIPPFLGLCGPVHNQVGFCIPNPAIHFNGTALKQYLEATAGTECNGASSLMITSWSMHAALLLCRLHWLPVFFVQVHSAACNLESCSWHWARKNHLPLFMFKVPLSLAEEVCSGSNLLGSAIWWGPGRQPFSHYVHP